MISINGRSTIRDIEVVYVVTVSLGRPSVGRVIFTTPLTLLSSSAGIVKEASVDFDGDQLLSIYVEYPKFNEIQCIVCTKEESKAVTLMVPQNANNTGKNKNIQASVSAVDDIIIEFKKQPIADMWVCFGEDSDYVLASDYVFKVLSGTNRLVVPIEIFWEKHYMYTGQAVGLFELSKSGPQKFVVYRKNLISNTLRISGFPQKHSERSILSPTGENLSVDNKK